MELYGYHSIYSPAQSRPPPRKMQSIISFPGSPSSGRRGSLPAPQTLAELAASPASGARERMATSPVPRSATLPHKKSSPKRPQTAERMVKSRKKPDLPDASALEAEVKRLMNSCEVHEARIKEIRANIETNLFPNLNGAISSISDVDQEADGLMTELDDALKSNRPVLSAKLASLISTHQAKVAQLEESSTPWRRFRDDQLDRSLQSAWEPREATAVTDSEDEGTHDPRAGERKILRIKIPPPRRPRGWPSEIGGNHALNGEARNAEAEDAAGIARMQAWADEVENYLTSEIAILQAKQEAEKKRWGMLVKSSMGGVGMAVLAGFLAILYHHWQKVG